MGGAGSRALRRLVHLVTKARVPRPQWPGCLLASAGSLFRSRVEKKLAHLAGHIAGDGSLLRPCECLIHIGGFQYPKSARVLLGLGVRSVGDEHLAVGLLRSVFALAAGEMPQANFLTPAAINSRLSTWISSIIASVTTDGSKSSGR